MPQWDYVLVIPKDLDVVGEADGKTYNHYKFCKRIHEAGLTQVSILSSSGVKRFFCTYFVFILHRTKFSLSWEQLSPDCAGKRQR